MTTLYGDTKPLQLGTGVHTLAAPSPVPRSGLSALAARVKIDRSKGTITQPKPREVSELERALPKAEYLKDVTAYQEGDGVLIYFKLAASDGQLTAASGDVDLTLYAADYRYSKQVYYLHRTVAVGEFGVVTVGLGAFERTTLVYKFPRIPFREMLIIPPSATRLDVTLLFRTIDGREFRGNDSAYLKPGSVNQYP